MLLKKKAKWLLNAENYFTSTLVDSSYISWAAYYSSVQQASVDLASIIAMRPLFFEKADPPEMVGYSINLTKRITNFIAIANQIP